MAVFQIKGKQPSRIASHRIASHRIAHVHDSAMNDQKRLDRSGPSTFKINISVYPCVCVVCVCQGFRCMHVGMTGLCFSPNFPTLFAARPYDRGNTY